MRTFLEERPLVAALLIWAADIAFVLAGAAFLSRAFPDLPGYGTRLSQSLVLVLLGVVLVAALLTALGWWRRAGFVGPAAWHDLRILWLPVVLLFLPLLGGMRPLGTDELLVLSIAYAATAFFEEALYRGLILGLLRPKGLWLAVILSSVLFGLVHLSNIVLRGNPSLIALQALGAGVQGVGFAALRIRNRTIWPVIGLHAFHDLFLQMGRFPIPLVEAVGSTILLVYAIYLLRPGVRARLVEEEPLPPQLQAQQA